MTENCEWNADRVEGIWIELFRVAFGCYHGRVLCFPSSKKLRPAGARNTTGRIILVA